MAKVEKPVEKKIPNAAAGEKVPEKSVENEMRNQPGEKSIVDKVIDAVDSVIHPHSHDVKKAAPQTRSSADKKAGIQGHPKFAKFKTGAK
jgi:hypothetical protein